MREGEDECNKLSSTPKLSRFPGSEELKTGCKLEYHGCFVNTVLDQREEEEAGYVAVEFAHTLEGGTFPAGDHTQGVEGTFGENALISQNF